MPADINITELVAQIIGIFAMVMNVLSFQQRDRRAIICFQIFGTALFAVNYFLLGATVGAILNCVGIFRALVYYFGDFFKSERKVWLVAFVGLYVLSYVLTFTLFGKEPTPVNLALELLPVVAMSLTTVSYGAKEARTVRIIGIVNAPMWMTYNVANTAIGAMLCEIFNAISCIIGLIRFDIKKVGGESDTADDKEKL